MPRVQKNESRRQIDQLEDEWRNAVLKGNVTALESLIADDYVGILANGTLETKEQMLDSLKTSQWHVTSYEVSERKVRFYGRTALVTSLVEMQGTGPGGDITGAYRYTRVYACDTRGMWKVVNFEANRLGHPHHPGGPDTPDTPSNTDKPETPGSQAEPGKSI